MASLRESIPLQKIKVIKKSITAITGFTILAGILGGFVYAIPLGAEGEPRFIGVLVPMLRIGIPLLYLFLVVLTPCYEQLYFSRYFYDMDNKNITIRKGVFAKKEIVLPFSRITDVYIDQDILDAMFGLHDVHMSTPTEESGQFAHIDGVDKEGSVSLRDMILQRINAPSN